MVFSNFRLRPPRFIYQFLTPMNNHKKAKSFLTINLRIFAPAYRAKPITALYTFVMIIAIAFCTAGVFGSTGALMIIRVRFFLVLMITPTTPPYLILCIYIYFILDKSLNTVKEKNKKNKPGYLFYIINIYIH